MHPRNFLFLFTLLSLRAISGAENPASASGERVSAGAVIDEMNLARQSPATYAIYLEEMRSRYDGDFLVLPGRTRIRTKEGLRAVDEAIKFLHSTKPLQPLIRAAGMCRGAADHCADQAGGRFGHGGTDGSSPGQRMNRYGVWGSSWGENISYGKTTAREVVLTLIIDDGLRSRKHRKNIFNSKFNYAGAASGPHAQYRTVCSIDFAGSYTERDRGLVARSD
ncbi:MAG: CAP domain-containing protein [Verrucomicrobiota bacterium]